MIAMTDQEFREELAEAWDLGHRSYGNDPNPYRDDPTSMHLGSEEDR